MTARWTADDCPAPALRLADPNVEAWANAAYLWARRGDRAQMLANIHQLDQAQVLAAWQAANQLVAALAERHGVLAAKESAS